MKYFYVHVMWYTLLWYLNKIVATCIFSMWTFLRVKQLSFPNLYAHVHIYQYNPPSVSAAPLPENMILSSVHFHSLHVAILPETQLMVYLFT